MEQPSWCPWILSEVLTKPLLDEAIAATAKVVNEFLGSVLPDPTGPEGRLHEAMRYGTLGGGKRLRPFLMAETVRMFGVDPRRAAAFIGAVGS